MPTSKTTLLKASRERYQKYLAWLERQPLADETRLAYRYRINRFLGYLSESGEDLRKLLANERELAHVLRTYKRHLKQHLKSRPNTVNAYLTAIDHFVQFLGGTPALVAREEPPQEAPKALDENNLSVPAGYEGLLEALKEQIKTAQRRYCLRVNTQAIELYYNIGRAIVDWPEQSGWGSAVLKRLSKNLASAFPDMKGFSESNLYRMRRFYLAYRAIPEIFATAVAKIPWGHNIVILNNVKDPQERSWYVAKTLEHGWSRSILEMQIESGLYRRHGRAVTKFSRTLPAL